MSQQKLPDQPSNMIDLLSDNEGIPQPSHVIDLTNDSSSDASLGSNMLMDAQTPSLTSGHGQKQGYVISPNTQFDSSSDDERTLGSTLTQCRKRKYGSGSTVIPKFEPDNISLSVTKKALQSFPEIRSLKPSTNFWTINQTESTQPALSSKQPQKDSNDKDNQRIKDRNRPSDPRILNIDRSEVLGRKDKRAHSNKAPTQHNSDSNRHEPAKIVSEEAYFRQGYSLRTVEVAEKPEGSNTIEVPQPNANNHINSEILEAKETVEGHSYGHITQVEAAARENASTEGAVAGNAPAVEVLETASVTRHTTPSNITSRAKPKSFAFDDKVSAPSFTVHRSWPGDPSPASQPSGTQGTSRPSSSTTGRRGRLYEITQTSSSYFNQRPSSRSLSPPRHLQPRRVPVAPKGSNRAGTRQLHKSSLVDDAKRTSSQSKKAPRQQQYRNKDTRELAEEASAQQWLDELFDSDAASQAPSLIQDVQRALDNQNGPQPGRRKLTDVGDSQAQHSSGGHIREHQPASQPVSHLKPRPQPSTIKLPTNPARSEPNRSYATRNETFEDAAASFNLLQSQHEKKRTTIMLDSVPADLGMPSRASRKQAVRRANVFGRKPRNAAKSAETKRMRYRERAIEDKRRKLEEEHASEPDEVYRERLINEKLNEYCQKFAENDRKRKDQARNYLTVDFLEDGAGTEDVDDHNSHHHPGGRGAPATRPRGAIPAAQAMESTETTVVYAVYISEPFEEGDDYEKHMQRVAEAFLKKEEANAFAQELLTGAAPSSRQPPQDATGVWYKTDARGLLFGRKWLYDGKVICCMVEKEKQIFGMLDMRDKWVREEVKDLYRPRFDVFITNVIPKVFLDKEEEDKNKRKEQKAKDAATKAEAETETAKPTEEGGVQEEESETEGGPCIWKPDDGKGEDSRNGDSNNLFSPTPTPAPDAAQEADHKADHKADHEADHEVDHEANHEASSQSGRLDSDDGDADNDNASVASDRTLQPSQPGGALGKLSWSDVEYCSIHAGSYTDLRLANEEAFRVARLFWKPRNARMSAWLHYEYVVIPSIEEGKLMDLDLGRADIVFQVPEIDGLVEHRPWLFIHSRIYVVEAKLEGPRDIACDFVVADSEDE